MTTVRRLAAVAFLVGAGGYTGCGDDCTKHAWCSWTANYNSSGLKQGEERGECFAADCPCGSAEGIVFNGMGQPVRWEECECDVCADDVEPVPACTTGPCPSGQYESDPCSLRHDRFCSNCSGACPSGQYQRVACTSKADRECTDCTTIPNCTAETCTTGSDHACTRCIDGYYLRDGRCHACSADDTCPLGYFLGAACTATSDRSCTPCSGACPPGTYQGLECTRKADRACVACSGPCPPGQFESVACSATADRECAKCSSLPGCEVATCTTGSDQACTRCSNGYYLAGGICTACAPIQNCAMETCTTSSDQTCTGCGSGYYLAGGICTACAPIQNCAMETCTTGSDQTCTGCGSGYYLAGGLCIPCSGACPPGYYESSACAATVDRLCTAWSCQGLDASCGASGKVNCCESPLVTGGTYDRSYDGIDFLASGSNEATVSDFRLDRYEITVGRFRAFLKAGQGTRANPPAAGAGGRKLNGAADQGGWDSTWNDDLAPSSAALAPVGEQGGVKCDPLDQAWTDEAGAHENWPMNCMTWYEAFAFCAWDGGFLPTEAEWNYAAAGGSEQRYYPWSSAFPPGSMTIGDSYAVYSHDGWDGSAQAVGSRPSGNGRWGQADLAGNVFEWVLDGDVSVYPSPCVDCATLTGFSRVIRGGCFDSDMSELRAAARFSTYSRSDRAASTGARCARTP